MPISPRTRRAVSTVLALVLAVETVTVVAAAAATRTVTHPLPADPPAGAVLAAGSDVGPVAADAPIVVPAAIGVVHDDEPDFEKPRTVIAPVEDADPEPAKADTKKQRDKSPQRDERKERDRGTATGTKEAGGSRDKPSAKADKVDRQPTYRGTNHVWIPQLGISRSIRWFPCDRQRPPDNYMYRWGCSGTNNVYLMGHAHSVMKPLHDAYVSGRLRKGMKAYYADANGKVRAYAVKWWRTTLPTTDAAWAWAPQARPSMTLQTCVGKNSKYRLMVRLVQVDG